MQKNGPNSPYNKTPYDVYQYLKLLDVDLHSTFVIDNDIKPRDDSHTSSSSEGLFHTPIARAAFVEVDNKTNNKKPLYPDRKHTKHITKASSRYNRCSICNQFHPTGPDPELRCPARGPNWIQDWKLKAAAKYNAMHPNDKPNPEIIQAPPPVRSGTTKPTLKQACLPIEESDQSDASSTESSEPDFQDAQEDFDDEDSSDDDDDAIEIRPESKIALTSSEQNSCSADSDGLYRYAVKVRPESRMAISSSCSTVSDDLYRDCLIGTPDACINELLTKLIQTGANKCTPRPKYAKILWINIDSGANIHISNDVNTVRRTKSCPDGINQVDGKPTPPTKIGHWTFWLGNRFVHSRSTHLMPNNPTSTLGSAALKLRDGYISTNHDQFDFITYIHADGSSFSFTKENKLFRTINALDYIPIIFYMNSVPHAEQPVCKQTQFRKSNRARKQTTKMIEYQRTQKPSNYKKIQPTPTEFTTHHPSSPLPQPTPTESATIHHASSKPMTTKEVQTEPTVNDDDKIVTGSLSTLITHLKFGCRNHKSLRHMHTTNSLDDMPSISLPKLPCPICLLVKNTRVTKNKETNMGQFRPGQLMMMDFAFFSSTSIRGYVAYFSVTCQSTGYGFVFCVPNKRPPLSLINWIAETLKRQGRPISFARFDEGGELARSQQVCQLLIDLKIIMQTTGGYASNLLGKDERQHRALAEMITSMLYAANLPPSYWCFAIMYAIYIKRRWCNYPESTTPYEKWFGSKPSFKHLHIFGAPITITDENHSKEKARNFVGRFLGFGSTSAVVIYQDIGSGKIKRARNCRIDDYFTLTTTHPQLSCPASHLIQAAANKTSCPTLSKNLPLLEYVPSPFQQHKLFTYSVTLPQTGGFGLVLQDDEHFGLPVIISMEADSPFLKGCQKSLHRQAWIINIHQDEPITVERALEYMNYLRKNNILTFKVTLSNRLTTQKTKYEELRSRFDSIRPIVSRATVQFSSSDTNTVTFLHLSPAAKFAVYSPTKPIAPKNWKELSHNDLREYWVK